ncbi:YdcH family protein [Arcobacter sp.]|uniref:YdcH family protein n=1 Tax=Arcobacter sp. TaxID=1872629 RepID=UPI003C7318B2
MFHEYREEITKLKESDNYFHNLFEKHNALDEEIESLVKSHGDEFTIEAKKKEKLKLKDEVFNAIIKYKKENNL